MESVVKFEVDLFGDEVPSLDQIKVLTAVVNSSERSKIYFAEMVEENINNNLAAGIGLSILGQNQKAMEKLNTAENCKEKHFYLANSYRQSGQFDKAIKSLDAAAKKDLDALMVSLEKAATYRLAGKLEDTEKQLATCSNFEKVSAEYHFQLGRLKDAQGDYQEAIDNYEIAVELDENHQHALFHLAYACDLRGKDDAAVAYYKQITKNSPTYVNALLNLAVLYEDHGDYDKAANCVDTVLKAHPNHQKAILFSKDIESSKFMVYDEEREKQMDQHNKILEIPISDFELSVRSRNCLKKMNIFTIGDLLRISEAELLSYKNFGETSLTEIKVILDSRNLKLGMAIDSNSGAFGAAPMEIEGADKEILAKSIDDLELSVRSKRAVSKLGIRTIAEIVSKTEAELLGCKNFGVTSLNEIKDRLVNFGLSLRKLE